MNYMLKIACYFMLASIIDCYFSSGQKSVLRSRNYKCDVYDS